VAVAESPGAGVVTGPIVRVQGLRRRLGATEALAGISFELRRGEIVVLLGDNGAGKTTLLRAMSGLLRPGSGAVLAAGRPVTHSDPVSRAGVAYVGHQVSSYAELTVLENVRFAAKLNGLDPADARIESALRGVDLWRFRSRRARELSRGMRQRLELALALATDPAVILLDEPYNALDTRSREAVDALLLERKTNAALLIATHDIEHAERLADRVLLLQRGRLLLDARLDDPGRPPLREMIADAVAAKSRIADESHQPALPMDSLTRHRPGPLGAWHTLVAREFRAELRSREFVPAMVVLGVLMLMVFSMAFIIPPEDAAAVASGSFWASLIFATILGAVRGFAVEHDRGTLQMQLLAPISRAAVFGGKWVVNFVSIGLVGLVVAAVTAGFFRVPFAGLGMVAIVLVAALALATVATLYGALLTNTRARELLAPVLMLPVILPIMIGGVAASLDVLGVTPEADGLPWLGLVLAYCAILLSLSMLLVDFIFED
jgi:ABC-type multidrug transport system ATPase subunit/ABC-type transport system involved in cytochrome c biogenesis permease component